MSNETPTRALTVRQPWASLIVYGIQLDGYQKGHVWKDIENRDWWPRNPPARIWIHAARGFDSGDETKASRIVQQLGGSYVPAFDWLDRDKYPRGVVLGHVALTGCLYNWPAYSPWAIAGTLRQWQLADPVPLPQPVPAKGRLGLWPWTPPEGGAR